MSVQRPTREAKKAALPAQAAAAIARLARVGALATLVRGALPTDNLKRLLKDALPARVAREMPPEVWSSFAAGIAAESPVFALALAQELHDRLSWDREPRDLVAFWPLVRERPLEALWMAALSESRPVRKEFSHIAQHCLANFRSSPECTPPSWEFLEGVLDIHAQTAGRVRDAEKELEAAERRFEGESQHLRELREELRRLRRENSELRTGRAVAERRAEALADEARKATEDTRRLEELERRALRAEKEREHALRELERRLRSGESALPPSFEEAASETGPFPAASPLRAAAVGPRERVLRQILKRLFNKGKIGASHTHEDNVLRGVADHEKGIAKEAMALLYREGFLVPKPTVTDPHVSLNPDRTNEIRAIIDGRVESPRLRSFFQDARASEP
jgi:hypothetical protein